MTRLALLLTLALLGCNGSSSSAPRPTASVPSAPPSTVYDLAPAGSDTLTGPVGVFTGPLAVVVTQGGRTVDGVNVAFRSSGSPASWGPWGLGDTLSGLGMWHGAGPGTGIAAVGCTPAIVGSVQVEAHVVPVVASIATPLASSNTVTFTVTGR